MNRRCERSAARPRVQLDIVNGDADRNRAQRRAFPKSGAAFGPLMIFAPTAIPPAR
jgi:hypothetical protein